MTLDKETKDSLAELEVWGAGLTKEEAVHLASRYSNNSWVTITPTISKNSKYWRFGISVATTEVISASDGVALSEALERAIEIVNRLNAFQLRIDK